MRPRSASSPFGPGVRVLMGLLGAGSFGTGVVAVFVSNNGTGTGVLLAFGGAVLVVALLGGRIESLEFGGTTLRLRAAAAERFSLAEQSEQYGDTATADRLRAEAQALLDAAGPIAADYRRVRGVLPAGPVRTRAMERIVAQARCLAAEQPFEPAEVLCWLQHGTDEERITALAMMQARPELRNFDAVLTTITDPRSRFEQFHAMLLAAQMIDGLDPTRRLLLAEIIRSRRRRRRRGDTARLRKQLLERLDDHPPAD